MSTSVDRATASDVARRAGVSPKTVYRVLSDAPHVTSETRARVLEAVTSLAFRPNGLARDLRAGGVSTTVGFVIGDVSNPFYASVASGVENALAKEGLTLLLAATADSSRQEPEVVAAVLERRVRALLLVPVADDHAYLEGERRHGTPVVAVDRPLADLVSDSVVFDNQGGARAGAAALLAAGRRRVAFVGSSSSLYTHRARLDGYRAALIDAGLSPDPALERTDAPDIASAARATAELLDGSQPPDALFVANNRAGIGVLETLLGRDEDLALMVFDDFDLAGGLGVSVVAHDPRLMGETAAGLALARLAGDRQPARQVVLGTQVVLRRSHLGRPSGLAR